MAGKSRDTSKYVVRRGRTTIKAGITNNLDRREGELKRELGDDVKVSKVGNQTTREGALEWERQQRDELTHRD